MNPLWFGTQIQLPALIKTKVKNEQKIFKIHILTETPCNYGTCRLKFKPPICSKKFAQAHKTLHKNNAPEAHLLPTPRFWVTAWQHTAPPNKNKIAAIISKCVQNFTHIIFCCRILTTFHLSMHFFRFFFFLTTSSSFKNCYDDRGSDRWSHTNKGNVADAHIQLSRQCYAFTLETHKLLVQHSIAFYKLIAQRAIKRSPG